jgi:hypothetical protein
VVALQRRLLLGDVPLPYRSLAAQVNEEPDDAKNLRCNLRL